MAMSKYKDEYTASTYVGLWNAKNSSSFFYCYTVHFVELLNYYTNHCTYIWNLHIKTLKTLRHVSVLRPSSGNYIFHAKVTLEIVTD